MGRRRSGRRRSAGDSYVSGSSSGSTGHQQSTSSCKSTVHQPTRLSQQSGAAAAEASSPPPPPPPPPRRRPTEDTPALRRRLLGLIRGCYIDAIWTTLARGLLVGGHCYGPLHPVDNIIANSVCLLHICPFLSPTNALWQLVRSRADLRVAIASASAGSASVLRARSSILPATEPEVVKAAFQMAAEAAKHPNPTAFAIFASSVLPDVEPDVSRLLASKRSLSSLDIRRLSSVLLHCPLPSELSSHLSPPDASPKVSKFISDKKRGAIKYCNRLLEIADAALCKFTSQTGLHCELHTVYGDSLLDDECFNKYFHINFMAQPQRKEDQSSSSGAVPGCCLFFFAEAPYHHNFREEDISICCLVEPSPPDVDNCHTCLMHENKIDHPASDPVDHTHDLCIGGQCYEIGAVNHEWDFGPTLSVDYLFFDPDRDSGLVEFLHNYFARIDAYCAGLSDNEDDAPWAGNYCRQLA